MGTFYINLGRWADSIIGPFQEKAHAENYIIDREINWRGQRPKVVTVAAPKPTQSFSAIVPQLTATLRATLANVLDPAALTEETGRCAWAIADLLDHMLEGKTNG